MRILIVDPGFSYSTLGVAQSYYNAFVRAGYEVTEYETETYLKVATEGYRSLKLNNLTPHHITEIACSPVINQVINDRIDVVLMVHGYFMNPSIIASLRNLGVKTGLILTDDPMQVDASRQWAAMYEYVFSNERNTVRLYKNGHYLPVAVDPTAFFPREYNHEWEKKPFESHILLGGSLYKERVEFIEKSERLIKLLSSKNFKVVGSRKIEFITPELNKCLGEKKISLFEMGKYMAGTDIVLDIPKNEYNDVLFGEGNSKKIKATCLSPRIFEALASNKICFTSNDREDIKFLFLDYDIPTYSNQDELCDLIEDYKKYEPLFNELYVYTIKNHLYDNRVQDIERIMNITPSKKDLKYTPINNVISNRWEKNWLENFNFCKEAGYYTPERNINKFRTSLDEFRERCVANTLNEINIISNGPSFEHTREKIIGDSNCRIYLNEAINYAGPEDWVCVIHPNEDVFDRCFKYTAVHPGMTLFASTIADHNTIDKFIRLKSNVYFFNTGDEGIKKEVLEHTRYPMLGSGHTVGYSAIAIAIYLGFKKINIYGLDFCYLENKEYAYRSLPYDRHDVRNYSLVPNKSGNVVLTNHVLLKSRDAILNLMRSVPNIKFKVHGDGLLFSKELENLENVR